ncbi:MAG: phosphatase PAP2 family protein [Thaumarchaeota archaeon]|nr:phosphatase PAP2 family protein [Nitrososphaerota archaeon]
MRSRSMAVVVLVGIPLSLALAAASESSLAFRIWDLKETILINHSDPGKPLDSLLVLASDFGREYFWGAIAILLALLGDGRTKRVALGLAVLIVLGVAAGDVAKAVILVDRPPALFASVVGTEGITQADALVVRVPLDLDSSFPSGHALIVSICASYCFLSFSRKWLAGVLAIEAAMVCFSRVYVGVHFPSDVLGGVGLGTAIAMIGYVVGTRYLGEVASRGEDVLVRVLREGPLRV